MMISKLYILGSNKVFQNVAVKFIEDCGGKNSKIMIILSGGEYLSQLKEFYLRILTGFEINKINFIYPNTDGLIEEIEFLDIVSKTNGLIIGGGKSYEYYRNYVKSPFNGAIRSAYKRGVPIMGCSGGALITPEIYLKYSETEDVIKNLPGLNLLNGYLIGVHFDKKDTLPFLLNEMSTTRTEKGVGISEYSCAVFSDNLLTETIGEPVLMIRMTDFNFKTYKIKEF